MYGSYYNNQLNNIDRINSQIQELEKMKNQMQQPQPSINQTFQIAPSGNTIRYANSIADVEKEVTVGDTPFFSKDMSVLWIKNSKGEIKSYALEEIAQKDEKDIKIEYLQAQIEQLRKEIGNNESSYANDSKSITNKESRSIQSVRNAKKK